MSGSQGYPIPNFPAVGWVGAYANVSYPGGPAAKVLGDQSIWVGGYAIMSMLAELRVHSILLAAIANVPDNLAQLRADAIADMGTLYASNPATPVPSS